MHVTRKWDQFGSSIFSTMTAASNEANAVNLAQGFPDFDGPDKIKSAAIDAITQGANQYAPAHGIYILRDLVARRRLDTTGVAYDPESETTVCSGATEGLFSALQSICEIGDEVISFSPFYDSYHAGVHAAGAKLREVKLHAPNWTFDADDLKRAVSTKTRAIIINSPHNPSGRVFTLSELQIIADICIEHDLIALTDEVYEEIWFSPTRPMSISQLGGMRERTVVVSSAAKTFSFTGWKVGYVFAPVQLTKQFRAVHQFTVFCTATPLQHGIAAGLQLGEPYYEKLRRDYKSKRDELAAVLRAHGFEFSNPEGSYFILADYSKISQKNDLDFALWLTNHAKVAAVPISPFYIDQNWASNTLKYVRFAFCKRAETIKMAAEHFQTCFSC